MTRLILLIAFVVATSPGAVRTSHSAGEDSGRFPEVPHRTSTEAPKAGDTTLTTEAVSATGGSADASRPVVVSTEVAGAAAGSSGSTVPLGANTTATATWCAPTPRYCKGWDTAYVGARWSFRWGDKPYAVQVCGIGYGCTVVRVVSFCACRDRKGIDLSLPAWREIGAPFGLGRIDVTIRRVPTLPATDVGGKP